MKSSFKVSDGSAGDFTLTAGKWFADEEADKGIQTGPDSKFFATSAKLSTEFDNTGKDLVLQVRVFDFCQHDLGVPVSRSRSPCVYSPDSFSSMV